MDWKVSSFFFTSNYYHKVGEKKSVKSHTSGASYRLIYQRRFSSFFTIHGVSRYFIPLCAFVTRGYFLRHLSWPTRLILPIYAFGVGHLVVNDALLHTINKKLFTFQRKKTQGRKKIIPRRVGKHSKPVK